MNLAALCMSMPADNTGLSTLAVGDAYAGGFYAGRISIDGATYNLVCSPRLTGQPDPDLLYQIDDSGFDGNTSVNDGWLIQQNMIAAGIEKFPSQQFCKNMTTGGFTDWYVPSKLELEILYRAFKPTTTSNVTSSGANASAVPATANYTTTVPARSGLAVFRGNGVEAFGADYYFSATQGPSGRLYVHAKRFTNGSDSQDEAVFEYPIRAVRRVLAT